MSIIFVEKGDYPATTSKQIEMVSVATQSLSVCMILPPRARAGIASPSSANVK